jgi:S-adenosyl-L-methionine hydrolase (adenosine-forming)
VCLDAAIASRLLSGHLGDFCLKIIAGKKLANPPVITLTSDFGLSDHFVGTMKGVILKIAPEAEIVDICHSVQAYDVLDGALTIAQAYSYFPAGTVHIVVVDPGVGTARRPILATSDGHKFVAPDNGVLSLVYAREERVNVRHITSEHYFLQPLSNTFHGRDIFSPVGAYLGKGVDPEKFGEPIDDYVRFNAPKPKPVDEKTLRGVVLKVDRFGNLITNFTPQDLPAFRAQPCPPFTLKVGKSEVSELHLNYSEGAPNEVFAIWGSMGYLEVAANRGVASQIASAGKGSEVMIAMEGAVAATNGQ